MTSPQPAAGVSVGCGEAQGITNLLLYGITIHGRPFRPSDWAQRLAAAATVNCTYCGGVSRIRFNPFVKVLLREGIPCLWVSALLAEQDPPLYDFIVRFGRDNELRISRS